MAVFFFILIHIFFTVVLSNAFLAGSLLAAILIIPLVINLIIGIFWQCRYQWPALFILLILSLVFLTDPGTIQIVNSDEPFKVEIKQVVYGYPTQKTLEEAKKGELLLGGCTIVCFSPRWVLILRGRLFPTLYQATPYHDYKPTFFWSKEKSGKFSPKRW